MSKREKSKLITVALIAAYIMAAGSALAADKNFRCIKEDRSI